MTTSLRRLAVMIAVAAAVALAAPDAVAQTFELPAPRSTQGLFGRAPKGDGLDLLVSAFEGLDESSGADNSGVTSFDPKSPATGRLSGVDAALAFKHNTRRWSFGAAERSGVRYYRALADPAGFRQDGMLGLTGAFDRTTVTVSQSVSYSPFYSYSTLPQLFQAGATDAVISPEQVLSRRPALSFGTSGSLSQTIGHAVFTASASTERTDFVEEATSTFRFDSVYGRMLYHLNKDVGLVAGYGHQTGAYPRADGVAESEEFRNIEIGIDYHHALSLTRRTTIGFATGTTAVADSTNASGYRMVGEVRVSRELGRTWLATGSYHRGVELIAGFPQPVFADSMAINVSGAVTRRLTFSANGGYSIGELTRQPNGTDNVTVSARTQYALTRLLALTGDYTYYRYRFDNSLGLPSGIQQRFDRQSARVGLALWLPLFR